MITGQNAVGAASDLEQMKNATGAAEAAFYRNILISRESNEASW